MFQLSFLILLIWPYVVAKPTQAFVQQRRGRLNWQLDATADEFNTNKKRSAGKVIRPVNEFSRTIQTDKVTMTKREYTMQISASTEEMNNLATRFSLPNITALHADLIISRAVDRQETYSSNNPRGGPQQSMLASCIQVEGTVQSNCVQTCVRTNQHFGVEKEFRLFAIVRPCIMSTTHSVTSTNTGSMKQSQVPTKQKNRQKQMVQQQLKLVHNFMDTDGINMEGAIDATIHVNEDIIEDESILGENGILDVGELVAQTFRVKLDPYPKKKGTTPVSYSITG